MKLSIIISVFNEKTTLPKILDAIESVKLPLDKEIIIVDDASTDGTVELLKKIEKEKTNIHIIYQVTNRGKGAALRTGFKHATGDIILTQDADLEYDPEDYHELIKPIQDGKAEVVYGTRFYSSKGHLKEKQQFTYVLHYLGNTSLTFFTNWLYHTRITDMETGYKVFTKKVLASIPALQAERFDIEPELTAKILKKGFTIKEVPIHYYSRSFKEGKKITWCDGLYAAWILLKYRFVD